MPSVGEMSLPSLLSSMSPILEEGTYVFATTPDLPLLARLHSLPFEMLFREWEGWTVIAPVSTTQALGIESTFSCRKITLNVHSSLDAVGFIAAVAVRVSEAGVGTNPVSGFYHDHLFTPVGKEQKVIEILHSMAEEARAGSASQ